MADSTRIPDLLLERYALNELSAATKSDVEKRLAESPESRARLDEIRRDNDAMLVAFPPEEAIKKIERRAKKRAAQAAEQTQRAPWPMLFPIGSAVVMAGLAILLLRSPGVEQTTRTQVTPSGEEVTRIKGLRPKLLIFSKPEPGKEPAPLSDGATAQAHELLQLGYVAAGKPHGVILSIDGRGTATLHHPAAQNFSTRLRSGQVLLPSAYELDDAPLFERFFLITASAPIDVAAVMDAAQKLAADANAARTGKLALLPGLEQTSLLLIKQPAGPAP